MVEYYAARELCPSKLGHDYISMLSALDHNTKLSHFSRPISILNDFLSIYLFLWTSPIHMSNLISD